MVRKIIKISGLFIILIFIGGEIAGRMYGLCSFPLYIESAAFEYIHAPNQDLSIYGNKFKTNAFSMRSEAITEQDTNVILLIGDSVVNGGNLTDQDSLASTILEKKLSIETQKTIRVLNISAGSWGPDNAAAYISQYGLFHAKMICLVFSSHDAYDNMQHEKIVGIHPQFPNKQPLLAWHKIIERGVPFIKGMFSSRDSSNKLNKELGITEAHDFNSGFSYFFKIANEKKIPLLFYLHCTPDELNDNQLYHSGLTIIDTLKANKIEYINEIEKGISMNSFRDDIHYNAYGQRFLADRLFSKFKKIIINDNLTSK
jgi:hypothetical protein